MITIGNNNKIKNSNIGSDNKYKKILIEIEEWLKERQDYAYEYENVLNKIQELKEKYK